MKNSTKTAYGIKNDHFLRHFILKEFLFVFVCFLNHQWKSEHWGYCFCLPWLLNCRGALISGIAHWLLDHLEHVNYKIIICRINNDYPNTIIITDLRSKNAVCAYTKHSRYFPGGRKGIHLLGHNLCIFLPFQDVLGLFDKISCFFLRYHSHACYIQEQVRSQLGRYRRQ